MFAFVHMCTCAFKNSLLQKAFPSLINSTKWPAVVEVQPWNYGNVTLKNYLESTIAESLSDFLCIKKQKQNSFLVVLQML